MAGKGRTGGEAILSVWRLLLFDVLNGNLDVAISVLTAGHVVSACGEMAYQGHPMKQEPA